MKEYPFYTLLNSQDSSDQLATEVSTDQGEAPASPMDRIVTLGLILVLLTGGMLLGLTADQLTQGMLMQSSSKELVT